MSLLTLSGTTESRETRALATELKFLVTPAVAREIRAWARTELAADPYGAGPHGDQYLTTSLYFDNEALDVFHRRGSFGRAKYRVRRYGESAMVFLERKMRTSALLAKRRTAIALDDLAVLQDPHTVPGWAGAWFHDRLRIRRLQPLVQVSYRRMARVMDGAHGTVRLTVDEDLRTLSALDFEFRPVSGRPVLADRTIVEIKFRKALPAKFKSLIEMHRLVPARLSKYRLAQDALQPRTLPAPVRLDAESALVYA
jgi:VTC domain-containing protein